MRTIKEQIEKPASLQPFLWGMAAAAALDQVVDIKFLIVPIILVLAAASAQAMLTRRAAQ